MLILAGTEPWLREVVAIKGFSINSTHWSITVISVILTARPSTPQYSLSVSVVSSFFYHYSVPRCVLDLVDEER